MAQSFTGIVPKRKLIKIDVSLGDADMGCLFTSSELKDLTVEQCFDQFSDSIDKISTAAQSLCTLKINDATPKLAGRNASTGFPKRKLIKITVSFLDADLDFSYSLTELNGITTLEDLYKFFTDRMGNVNDVTRALATAKGAIFVVPEV